MEVGEAIKKRRSVRKYLDKAIPDDKINDLIEAARISPSAYNAQPWKFKIITNKKTIKKFEEEKVFKHPFVYTAPLIIVCCGLESSYPERASDNFKLRDLVYTDLGIAGENIVLKALELDLGTCYVGIIDREKLKSILEIPEDHIVPFVITIGYPDEEPSEKPRKSREEIIF